MRSSFGNGGAGITATSSGFALRGCRGESAALVRRGGALQLLRHRHQLRGTAPADPGGFDAHRLVALALAGREAVDPVEGAAGGLDVLVGEVLPDEAADRADAGIAEPGDLVELVVLIEQDQVDSGRLGPGEVLVAGDQVVAGGGHPLLRPDAFGVDPAGLDVRLPRRPGQDVGLVPEPVEGRPDLAGDDGLPAVEPVGDDPDPHRLEPLHDGCRPGAAAGMPT